MIFGLFWLTFACCVSDFAVFGSVFPKKKARGGGTSGCPWGRVARGASPPRASIRAAGLAHTVQGRRRARCEDGIEEDQNNERQALRIGQDVQDHR